MASKPYIFYGEMDSPLGSLTIVSTIQGICRIDFGAAKETYSNVQVWAKKHMLKCEMVCDLERVGPAVKQLEEYFAGSRFHFDLPLVFKGTPFQKKVWQALKGISYGETKSYKEIAQSMGAPKAVRAVGNANNKNPIPIIIPCHRVIGSNGALVGYGGGVEKKETLLEIEKSHRMIS
jgi:methylated-DNA-[protein]-cysteine S-methyltransferase